VIFKWFSVFGEDKVTPPQGKNLGQINPQNRRGQTPLFSRPLADHMNEKTTLYFVYRIISRTNLRHLSKKALDKVWVEIAYPKTTVNT
jgi:hypothetical protein